MDNQTQVADFTGGLSGATQAWLKRLTNATIGPVINAASKFGVAGGHFPNATLNGLTYSNVYLIPVPSMKVNGLGLRLLARNLVTLDFPNRKIYLKEVSGKPLFDDGENTQEGFKFLFNLLDTNGLPGLPVLGAATANYIFPDRSYPFSGTLVIEKKGRPFTFHYVATKASEAGAWKLTRAWKSDSSGNIIQNFQVP